ncbi:hypothetical protein OS242_09465 [Tumebacillus sp. DT12]|uniref:Post-transcriptional regulator n=1 Tax=Tumebacillus lacus TaxID=2995335 RepID=A0ABT3X3M7_9BACL|nr:post-transcriptional regulator [Tumebacillus lacus]MCX7570190.1 hypothetical protein [Tumebacillus lacus]
MSEEHVQPEEEQVAPITSAEMNQIIEDICKSKADELRMLGIERVSGYDVWECVSAKYKKGLPPLHQLINDILTLKSHAFTNWLMIQMYKGQ